MPASTLRSSALAFTRVEPPRLICGCGLLARLRVKLMSSPVCWPLDCAALKLTLTLPEPMLPRLANAVCTRLANTSPSLLYVMLLVVRPPKLSLNWPLAACACGFRLTDSSARSCAARPSVKVMV